MLTSGPSESDAATAIAEPRARSLGPEAAGRIVLTDEFDLAELRVLVARAALYIGGDSGPLHIAATTRTPIVALYGPTLPARSAPWRDPRLVPRRSNPGPLPCRPCDQRACVPGDFRCLTRITPDAGRRGRRARARAAHATAAGAQADPAPHAAAASASAGDEHDHGLDRGRRTAARPPRAGGRRRPARLRRRTAALDCRGRHPARVHDRLLGALRDRCTTRASACRGSSGRCSSTRC